MAYPENEKKEKELKTKAVLKVQLWSEIYKKHGKHPPAESFWVLLKNITGIDPAEAQKNQSVILKWYNEDISNISEEIIEQKEAQNQQPQGLSLSTPNNNQMSQQLVQSKLIPSNPSTHELIQFGEVSLSLPKKDLRKQWGKLQKYMDIYLEDYEEDSDIDRSTSKVQ
ncbi:MAG: hypothetical protein QXW37_08435 [Candidatus Nitrosotenuis sp.]